MSKFVSLIFCVIKYGKKLREQIFARINYCGEKSENQKW